MTRGGVQRGGAFEEAAFLQVGVANLSYCAERGWVQLDALLGADAAATSGS